MIIINAIGPTLIDIGESLYTLMGGSGDTIQSISWLFIITIYLFLSLIIPLNYIYQGITTPNTKEGPNPFMQSILGIFLLFISILLTVKGWYIIEAFASFANNDPVLLAFYWIGIITTWTISNLIAPVLIIIQAQHTEE